ncbi:MAG TPA: ISAs1 family transposase, partial [Ktedonobacterales bacterium]|nr:ISAs1 family transposase [Ktedonobacterales bacterium]
SLHAAFGAIPDPRSAHGRRYDLPFLLTCLVAALLCNCNSTCAVGQWCREQRRLLRQVFGPRPHLTPSDSLYRRLLPRLSAEQLEAALAAWIGATRPADDAEAVALDGKAVRGAATSERAAPHLLAFCTHETQETLLQVRVADKTNEIPVAQAVAPRLRWRGRVCTADALHTQTAFVATIRAQGGDVLLTVKDNQPTLASDLALLFADPRTHVTHAHTVDAHRGRRETRALTVSTDLTAYLAAHSPWPAIAQVGRLTRRVTTTATGQTRTETVYLITTLSPAQASPQRLLALLRGHWHIENRLHYVRDVTFGEDRSRLRSGDAPQIFAALRNLAITLIHRSGSSDIAASRRAFAYHPRRALKLLLR